ncbi:PRC-barrel domain-containing protein [Salinarimonas soli]|nr:PRC-barrel domain-containing protein [Salinarimonas soli]
MRVLFLTGLAALALDAGAARAQVPSPGMGQTQADPAADAFVTGTPTGLRASKLEGIPVIDLDFKRVGEVKEVLIGKDGRVSAVILGIGGVLGVGERKVAVRFDQFLWNTGDSAQTAAVDSSMRPSEAPPLREGNAAAQAMPGAQISREVLAAESSSGSVNPGSGPVTTGSTATATAIVGDGEPDRAQVRLTREQLEKAPAFKSGTE